MVRKKNPLVLLKKEDTLLCIFSHAPVGEGSHCTCTLICSPTPLGFGLPPILGQPSGCFSILSVLYYSPQPWALQTQQSESPGCGLWLISQVWSHTSGPKSCFHGRLLPCYFEAHSWFMFASDLFHIFFKKEKSFPLMQENLIMQ